MASAALPPSHPPPPSHNTPPESPLSHRMAHHAGFFPTPNTQQQPPPNPSELEYNSNHLHHHHHYNNSSSNVGPNSDPYYQEASATSGSNSADEDEPSPGSKRPLHERTPSNKKRRKQSKPLRLTEDGQVSSGIHSVSNNVEEPSERRYSTEDEEGSSNEVGGGRCSEDSPLNLSSREPGEKGPSLRVLGPELMSPDFESGELKLGPSSAASLYQAAAAGMLPFGLGGPFPFPFPPKPGSSPRTPTSQIFNPEAYCELCNKEFCNKYFLKTHKANKHGIYTDPPPTTSSNNNCNSGPSEPPNANIATSKNSGSPFSGAFITASNNMGRPPFIPLSPPSHSSPKALEETPRGPGSPGSIVRPHSNENGELRRSLESPLGRPGLPLLFGGASKDHSDRIPAKSSFSQDKLRQMGVINADAFCEICCKEFCNKYFLRVHKLKKHGICSPDLPPEKVQKILSQMAKEAGKTGQPPPQLVRPGSQPKSPAKDHLDEFGRSKMVDLEEEEEGELIKKSSSEDLQRLQSMIMELNAGKGSEQSLQRARSEDESANGSSVCKICSKDMDNKFFLRAHLMNEHGILNPHEDGLKDNPFLPNGFLESGSKFLQQMSKGLSQPQTQHQVSEEERSYLERVKNELSGGLSPRKSLLDASKDPNRRPASLSRSYCEICKKELCNKYFMKTHMMKMHGINIEGGSGGPSPGLSGVSCHICKKELCSKYFLKVHLQNTHGIGEDGLPLPKENGSASSLFPSLFPPPPAPNDYPPPDKDPQYFSRLLGEQSEKLKQKAAAAAATEDAPFACPFCGEDLKELVLLQVHIIRSHGSFPQGGEPKSLNNNEGELGRKSPKTPPRGLQVSAGEIPPPSKASPSSSSVSSSNNDKASPPSNSFPNIELLQRHMLSTQFPGLINPLLSGLAAAGNSLSFPIQKLLGPPSQISRPKEKEELAAKTGVKRRVFKCPKCSARFRRRELCLSHLTSQHGLSIRRKLRFSPLKGALKKPTHRSEYVRHFMELLRFPTSRARATTSKSDHIMQPFLLKTPTEEEAFVPSLIYLPVARRVSGPLTVAFNLIPA